MNKIEKERKFLLKKLPVFEKHNRIDHISQCYLDGWRYRYTFNIKGGENKFTYEKLRKEKVDIGINNEVGIEEISPEQYSDAIRQSNKRIKKDRYVAEYKGRKFEIDYFYGMSLVICEIENVDMDTVIEWPPEIEKQLLMEVTGNPKFDNVNLAS